MFGGLSSWLFDPSGLTPHGFCLLWEPGLLWLHAASDIGTGLAYFTIPLALVGVIRVRPDLLFRPVFGLFAAFILLCGIGHLLDLLTLWVPAYGIEGVVKAATAVTSLVTAIVVWKLLPQALLWPSPAQLREVNSKLVEVQRAELRMAAVAEEASRARDELTRELVRREWAESQLRHSEERYRLQAERLEEANQLATLATESASIGLWDWNVIEDRMTWDPCMHGLFGMKQTEELLTYSSWRGRLHPDDCAAAEQSVRDFLEGTKPYAIQYRVIWDDGSVHHLRASGRAIRNLDGVVIRMIGASWDVTEDRIEEEQRAIIIEAAPNGMMIVNETGTITLANSQVEKIFGYTRGALVGQPVETLVPDNIRAAHGSMRSRFTGGQDVREMTRGQAFAGRKQDGSEVLIEILLSSVKTPQGRIVVASLFDVTERRRIVAEREDIEKRERLAMEATNAKLDHLARHLAQARDRAERANRAKSSFLAGMSHELRTPLSGIMGYAQLLHMEGNLNPTQATRVGAMLEAGKHLLEIIAWVLDLSEIEAEQAKLHVVEVDPEATVAACIDLVRPTAEAKGLVLTLDVTTGTPQVLMADPTRLRQVLLNFLGNAVKFTSQGGIAVKLGRISENSALRIEVADTGPGIPADQRQRLFNDFERLDTEATSKVEGAGLGLALSRRLAALMGGHLGLDDNPGGGSVFWLELPLDFGTTSLADVRLALELPGAPPAHLTRTLNVLVVDDVLMNRDIAGSFLRAGGHKVTCVESGAEAVAVAAITDFDVVLMDVRMPEMDGLEATRRIRAIEGERGQVPIVALTAQAFTEQITECRKAGMDSHLAKPFDPDTLLAAVTRAVSAGPAQGVTLGPTSISSSSSGASTNPTLGSELPVLDPRAFERAAMHLAPDTLANYLKPIVAIGESLTLALREPDALISNAGVLVETAHKLAGSAAMFGFERLASISRRFERAVETGADDVKACADCLCLSIEDTREEIRTRILQRDHPAESYPTDAEPTMFRQSVSNS